MSPLATRTEAYADLGDAWLRAQTVRIQQKHLQLGRHLRLDLDSLLERAARPVRAARCVGTQAARDTALSDGIRRATLEAIDLCARLEAA